MPNKLTDSEIKKALEICGTYKGKCTDCPAFVKVDRSNCKKVLLGALDLINRQEDKCKAYKHYYDECLKDLKTANAENESLKAEIERLREEIRIISLNRNMALLEKETLYDILKNAKAEAYQEFDELLKDECLSCPLEKDDTTMLVDVKSYNNLLNGLVGDGDGK